MYDKDGILMLLDFEKAFDMVDWEFINFALKKFNFPPYVISWINIIYSTKNESCIINNGWISQFFTTSRGVKQGCSLSPYIFIICLEFLTRAIKYQNDIQGIEIGSYNSKILQFADDTCLTLTYEARNILSSLKTILDFEKASGLKLNVDKTEILKLGPIARTEEKLCPEFNICWKNNYVRLLGIFLCNDTANMYEMNFEKKIGTARTVVNIWNQRNLTMYGKSLIVKTFILSQFMYQVTVLPTLTSKIDKAINNITFPFLWNNKPDKIKRTVICSNTEMGGLKFPNMSYYLQSTKLGWLKKIFAEKDIFNITSHFFKPLKYLNKTILMCNLHKDDVNIFVQKQNYTIIYEIFHAFYDINYRPWNKSTDLVNQIIWLNSCIKIDKKPIFNSKCVEKGIVKISDLMIDGILFITYDEFVIKYGNIINFLQFNGIIAAIKHAINVAKTKHCQTTIKELKIEKLIYSVKPQKYVYQYLCDMHTKQDNTLQQLSTKWNNITNNGIDIDELSQNFSNIRKITLYIKLRIFIYKYLHVRLYLNPQLLAMNLKDTDKCSLCDLHIESVTHLFFQCNYSRELWATVKQYVYSRYNYTLNTDNEKVIFPTTDIPLGIRTLIFITLFYIYNCRLLAKIPNKIVIIREFYKIETLEFEIAKSNGKMCLHKDKWNIANINV